MYFEVRTHFCVRILDEFSLAVLRMYSFSVIPCLFESLETTIWLSGLIGFGHICSFYLVMPLFYSLFVVVVVVVFFGGGFLALF